MVEAKRAGIHELRIPASNVRRIKSSGGSVLSDLTTSQIVAFDIFSLQINALRISPGKNCTTGTPIQILDQNLQSTEPSPHLLKCSVSQLFFFWWHRWTKKETKLTVKANISANFPKHTIDHLKLGSKSKQLIWSFHNISEMRTSPTTNFLLSLLCNPLYGEGGKRYYLLVFISSEYECG